MTRHTRPHRRCNSHDRALIRRAAPHCFLQIYDPSPPTAEKPLSRGRRKTSPSPQHGGQTSRDGRSRRRDIVGGHCQSRESTGQSCRRHDRQRPGASDTSRGFPRAPSRRAGHKRFARRKRHTGNAIKPCAAWAAFMIDFPSDNSHLAGSELRARIRGRSPPISGETAAVSQLSISGKPLGIRALFAVGAGGPTNLR